MVSCCSSRTCYFLHDFPRCDFPRWAEAETAPHGTPSHRLELAGRSSDVREGGRLACVPPVCYLRFGTCLAPSSAAPRCEYPRELACASACAFRYAPAGALRPAACLQGPALRAAARTVAPRCCGCHGTRMVAVSSRGASACSKAVGSLAPRALLAPDDAVSRNSPPLSPLPSSRALKVRQARSQR